MGKVLKMERKGGRDIVIGFGIKIMMNVRKVVGMI